MRIVGIKENPETGEQERTELDFDVIAFHTERGPRDGDIVFVAAVDHCDADAVYITCPRGLIATPVSDHGIVVV